MQKNSVPKRRMLRYGMTSIFFLPILSHFITKPYFMVSHRYAEGEKDIKDSNAEDGHSYIAFRKDSSYRRRPNRDCICYRRSSRRRGNGGWRPLPRPYK